MAIVTIIGAGMMGSALAFPARENGHTVRLTGTPLDREVIETCRKSDQHPKFERKFPAGVEYYQFDEVNTALAGCDLVICGVNSWGVEWFGDAVLPLLPTDVPVLSVTKGLMCQEDGSLINYPQFWQQKLDRTGQKNELCAIGGPCTSYELVAHDQTLVAFCGDNMETLKRLQQIMATDYYHIITTCDVCGIEAAVALKNGYALGVALTIGENFRLRGCEELHFNSQAGIFLQASREMLKLVRTLGGSEESFFVGVGDLYVTIYGGRTRQVGILLGEGLSIDEALNKLQGVTLESLVVAARVAKALRIRDRRGELDCRDYPLLMHVDDILSGKSQVNLPWDKFSNINSVQ